ncbi:sodium/glutamate symporter, partial [Acinetobacter baumannii]|uniref:sodium/glutamate symporter n=2 Tax=Acinetobacter baumannii TaxID=470 RepID=UPI001CB88817
MEFVFNGFYTLISAVIVLLLGRFLVNRIDFLKRYNIPEPVAGGLVAAVVSLLVHTFWGYSIVFSSELQTSFMLVFFASIGLSANFMKLKEGGTALVIFLICVASFIVVQNAVGMSLATLLGLDPLIGLIGHCCKVSDEAAFCLIQRPYISKTLLTRRISPRGS